MSKQIKTIQSSDKEEFDRLINQHLEQGWDLVEGSYSVLKDDVYSQVVSIDESKYNQIEYWGNGNIKRLYNLKNNFYEGKYKEYYKNGLIKHQRNYKKGKYDGKCINYFEDGMKLMKICRGQLDEVENRISTLVEENDVLSEKPRIEQS